MRVKSLNGLMVAWVLSIAAAAMSLQTAEAATVWGHLRKSNLSQPTSRITFTPTNAPFSSTNSATATMTNYSVLSDQFFVTPTNGYFSTLAEPGYYVVNFGPSLRDTWRIYVPPGTNSYEFSSLVYTNGPAAPPASPIFEQVARKGVASGYAPLDADALVPTNHLPAFVFLAISNLQWQIDNLPAGGGGGGSGGLPGGQWLDVASGYEVIDVDGATEFIDYE